MFMALIILLIVLIVFVFIVGLQGLVYWGIGSFICWAFSIPFTFTFSHGIAIALIVSVLTGIFKREVIIKNE